jgi:TonB-dependent SusC/RagA subfamily outer membrane receptor
MRHRIVSPFTRAAYFLGCVAAGSALAWAAPAAAQPTGTVGGTVVDAVSRRPLSGAQISIEGTQRGTLTDGRGRYLILQAPIGQHSVRVTYIGYASQSRTVTVTVGGAATADFELAISAVTLDEVVVTGTAGAVERRKVGSSMASMNVSQVRENIPVTDFGTALQARIPGVRSVGVVGGVGAGRALQIRGNNSFNLDQRPVVYIDGVRVNTYQYEWGGMAQAACCAFSGGAGEDRLSDISPEDIERVEVLKGAAAATLFGSEASNGVIQIFTKRGRSNSRPQFTMSMNYGYNRLRENIQTTLYPKFKGPQGFQAWDANQHLVENGPIQGVDLTAQGGGEDITYFVAGAYHYEDGSVKPNWQRRGNLRMNLRWVASSQWTFAVNTAYAKNRIQSLQSGNNWMSLLGNAVLGNPRKATEAMPFGEPWIAVSSIKKVDTFDDANRFTAGMTATYQPYDWFTNKVTVGMDNVDEEKARILPFGEFYTYVGTVGERNLGYRRSSTWTADYLGTMNFELRSDLSTELAFGAQGFWEQSSNQMATGRGFAGPGVTVVSGGSTTFGAESFVETINVGMFVQDRMSYKDKLFATVGLRVDGNSAFGENYGLKKYPKVDMAYQISREGFFPSMVSNLKLRAAIGQAGKFPGAFDQFQTFNAQSVLNDLAGVTPFNPGNADLKPETTTETELGFDAGFFQDRVGVTFTYYHAKTKDALLNVSRPPSLGFPQPRLENAGVIENRGWEATLNVTPLNSSALRWSVDLNLDGNKNKILDLGPQAVWLKVQRWEGGDWRTGGTVVTDSVLTLGGNYEGYPVRSQWGREIISWDPTRKIHTRSALTFFQGPPLPTFNASLANTFTFGAFRVYGLLTMQRGSTFGNSDRPFRVRQGGGDEYLALFDFNKRDAQGNPTPTAAADSLLNYYTLYTPFDKRDNIRLRELSVACTLPAGLSDRVGLGRTVVTLSGQNLMWWDDCNCMDPDMNYLGGSTLGQSGFLAMPQSRRFLLSIRTSFGG